MNLSYSKSHRSIKFSLNMKLLANKRINKQRALMLQQYGWYLEKSLIQTCNSTYLNIFKGIKSSYQLPQLRNSSSSNSNLSNISQYHTTLHISTKATSHNTLALQKRNYLQLRDEGSSSSLRKAKEHQIINHRASNEVKKYYRLNLL